MDIVPVNGHILVELPPKDTGVFIPDSLSDSIQEGTVLAVPTNREDVDGDIAVGKKVRWEKFAEADGSFKLTTDGKEITAVLIKASQVMGVWQ